MFALGVIVGSAAVVMIAAMSALVDCWRDRVRTLEIAAERSLPPASRAQLDRAARANRPNLRIARERDDQRMN